MSEHSGLSLAESHQSIAVPTASTGGRVFRKLLAFGGPAYLVSVGYIDPGNWATDLEGGSRFGFELLWVIVLSNLMAVLLQTLAARLGIVRGRDLAQACRDHYPKPITVTLWILCEIAIAACDLAEVLGTAIALNLLFGIPLLYGVILTAFDVLILLGLQQLGMRKLEAFIIMLVLLIGGCFLIEIFLAKPSVSGVVSGLVPRLNADSLYVAIAIIGATVMPHNLYLHSALVQTRRFENTPEGKRQACKFNLLDSVIALNGALFINGAILILAAAVFFAHGTVVTEIQQAHSLLTPLLGNSLGSYLFAIALLASGQSSTITGTLAGQVTMEGFVHLKLRPIVRRLLTRGLAIIPAVLTIIYMGADSSYSLLILSQVILSMQLAFAIIPLIHFTSDRQIMGEFANGIVVRLMAWACTILIVGLNANLLVSQEQAALESTGTLHVIGLLGLPLLGALALLLLYVTLQPWLKGEEADTELLEPLELAGQESLSFSKIGVALERSSNDAAILRRAIALAKVNSGTQLVLVHVAVSAGAQVFGAQALDTTSRQGEEYLERIVKQVLDRGVPATAVLGFGSAPRELIRIARDEKLDLLVMAAHGHRGIKDVLFGATISRVRHALSIPILVVR